MPEEEEEWLECLPWDGQAASLPVGEEIIIPDFRAMDLVRRWEVLDVEEDEGFRVVKKAELRPDDKIIGCQINENSFKKIVQTYGKDFFRAKRGSGGAMMNRWAWKKAYGSDVLELEALKQIRQGNHVFKI
jgi:hypothetical protein